MMLSHRHTTKDGKVILIAQMSTDHLLNLIRLRIRLCNKVFVASNSQQSAYKAKLYGLETISPEYAADLINRTLAELSPYILEAFFRFKELAQHEEVMKEITQFMQSFMQREGQLESTMLLPQLTSGIEDEDEIDEEEFDEH